ncbi:adenylyltransferase/cytidyltransferase family protein [Selenomonadales bacterium OttesenSCG-928-I06]|nr:adenylyltransferase/cytidyltransferase family protein [Selenomonadales bacterium OttesenSCG-928-I06]
MKIGYTTGVFDMFHIGHLNIFKQAKDFCDFLIVGVSTDELCQKLKNKIPVIPFSERIEIVSSIKYVDIVFTQTKIDRIADFNKYHFNIMFKGDDWKNSSEYKKSEKTMKELGIEIMFFPYTQSTSSTTLRKFIE